MKQKVVGQQSTFIKLLVRVSYNTFYHSILFFVVRPTQIRDLVVLEELDLGTDLFNVFYFILFFIFIFYFVEHSTYSLTVGT